MNFDLDDFRYFFAEFSNKLLVKPLKVHIAIENILNSTTISRLY